MFTATIAATTYLTPDDADGALGALVALLDATQHTANLVMYGFTHPALVDALCRAHQRGVNVRCIFDHTQSSGPTEVGMLHRLLLTVPAANIRIGTSPSHRQLIHLKCLVTDGLQTAEGSLNWSPSAFEQINDLTIAVSADRADAFTTLFEKQWAFLTKSEPQYQPAGISSSISTPSQSASSEPAA